MSSTDQELRAILENARTIAIVGASAKPERPSHEIMKILMSRGYQCIPVTPRDELVLGQKAYKTLAEIPEAIDIVDVFRRSAVTPDIARQAVEIRAKVLWLQLGISNDEAAAIAEAGGLKVIMNRCIGQTVQRLDITRAMPT